MIALTAAGTALLAGLLYAAVGGVSEWTNVVVLAGIVLATAGTTMAVDPLRRER